MPHTMNQTNTKTRQVGGSKNGYIHVVSRSEVIVVISGWSFTGRNKSVYFKWVVN